MPARCDRIAVALLQLIEFRGQSGPVGEFQQR